SLDELTREMTDVYFDLDKSEIRDDARAGLQKDADWLKRWTSTQVIVEGHCDSRGSAQYNLGLGSRRASAVKDYLMSLGVPASREYSVIEITLRVLRDGRLQRRCVRPPRAGRLRPRSDVRRRYAKRLPQAPRQRSSSSSDLLSARRRRGCPA